MGCFTTANAAPQGHRKLDPIAMFEAMVNLADIFQLLGEIVAIDVHRVVARSQIDPDSMIARNRPQGSS
jgi:hypothetical protein